MNKTLSKLYSEISKTGDAELMKSYNIIAKHFSWYDEEHKKMLRDSERDNPTDDVRSPKVVSQKEKDAHDKKYKMGKYKDDKNFSTKSFASVTSMGEVVLENLEEYYDNVKILPGGALKGANKGSGATLVFQVSDIYDPDKDKKILEIFPDAVFNYVLGKPEFTISIPFNNLK